MKNKVFNLSKIFSILSVKNMDEYTLIIKDITCMLKNDIFLILSTTILCWMEKKEFLRIYNLFHKYTQKYISALLIGPFKKKMTLQYHYVCALKCYIKFGRSLKSHKLMVIVMFHSSCSDSGHLVINYQSRCMEREVESNC